MKVFPCNWTPVERVERIVMLLCMIVLLLDLFVWRP